MQSEPWYSLLHFEKLTPYHLMQSEPWYSLLHFLKLTPYQPTQSELWYSLMHFKKLTPYQLWPGTWERVESSQNGLLVVCQAH